MVMRESRGCLHPRGRAAGRRDLSRVDRHMQVWWHQCPLRLLVLAPTGYCLHWRGKIYSIASQP
jgi:hypothetical protein